jgi:hypothetical protein
LRSIHTRMQANENVTGEGGEALVPSSEKVTRPPAPLSE